MPDKSVVVRLRANIEEYRRAMEDASKATRGLANSGGDVTQLGPKMSRVGGQLTRNVTLPLLAAGAAAGKLAFDFEATFARMEGLAGVAADEVDGLRRSVLELAGDTARAPQDVAEGLYFIRSAGLAGKTALEALDVSARGATAGLGSTAAVADAVTSAINAYGEASITAAQAGDVLAATAREGKAEAAALAPQFGRLLPIAAELGISFDQVGAGMAFLSRSSGDAALSATQLGGVLNKLLEPGEEGAKALRAVGSSGEKLRESVRERGLLATLLELRSSLEANGMSLNDFSRDQQFLQGALQLTGAGAADAAQVFDSLKNSTGTLGRAFDKVAKTDGFEMKQALARLQVALIEVGDVLLPLIAKVAAFGAGALAVLGSLPEPAQMLALAFVAVLVAAGPVVSVAGKLASNWATLVKVFDKVAISAYDASGALGASALKAGAVTAAVALAAYAWQNYHREMEKAQKRGEDLAKSFKGGFDATKVSMAELTAEIQRLSAEADKANRQLDKPPSGLWDRFAETQRQRTDPGQAKQKNLQQEALKSLRDELDAAATPMIALAAKAAELQARLGVTADEALDLARDTDFMAKATDGATGALDDEAAAAELVTKRFDELATQLAGMFDPLFAAQDSMWKLKDAQKAVAEAVAANSDANAKNNVTQEEMLRLHEDVVKAAVDQEVARIKLAKAVENGDVTLDAAIVKLQEWVVQGHITQAEADITAAKFKGMVEEADKLPTEKTITINLDDVRFQRALTTIKGQLDEVRVFGMRSPRIAATPRAAGGDVVPGQLYVFGEKGPELGMFDQPGQIFSHEQSRRMLAGALLPGPGASSSSSTDNSRNLVVEQLTVQSADSPRAWLDEALWRVAG